MKEEVNAIERNKTWELIELPNGKRPIGLKSIFKAKPNPDGNILKHKSSFLQSYGLDYGKVFAPIARHETVRVVVALGMKSAFLNGPLKESVFMSQSHGFVIADKENVVYKLHKALCGLKQATRPETRG